MAFLRKFFPKKKKKKQDYVYEDASSESSPHPGNQQDGYEDMAVDVYGVGVYEECHAPVGRESHLYISMGHQCTTSHAMGRTTSSGSANSMPEENDYLEPVPQPPPRVQPGATITRQPSTPLTVIDENNTEPGTRLSGFNPPSKPLTRDRCQWNRLSIHWRTPLAKLHQMNERCPDKLVKGFKQIVMCADDEFKIGEGCNGATIVYAALMTDGREVAVKEVLKRGNRWKESMQEEVDILVKLRPHANIVSYKLTEWPEGRFGYIVTELCEFSLNEWLEDDQVKRKSDEEWDREVPGLMTDLLSGLNHLHTHDPMFLHRDIKPQNVLVVFHNKKACLKLADFGISRSLADGQTAAFTNVAGTQTWQAAELIRQGTGIFDYRRSTDIQVCGMVAYYIKSRGKHPFAARTPHDIETKILANETDLSALNEPLVEDLVVSMLKPEPTDRPSAATLLRHPYFWTEEKRYKFLTAVGNEPEIVDSHVPENKGNAVRQAIECAKTDILPNKTDWSDLKDTLMRDMDQTKRSDRELVAHLNRPKFVTSVCKLVRTLRNVHEHYNHLSPGAKAMFGNTCYPYKFFDREVPKLFPTIYEIIKTSATKGEDWTKREILNMYFTD